MRSDARRLKALGFEPLYVKGEHFVLQIDGRFVTCDVEGCGPELYHTSDSYDTLEQAKEMVDFWASGGHWQDRPDMKS